MSLIHSQSESQRANFLIFSLNGEEYIQPTLGLLNCMLGFG